MTNQPRTKPILFSGPMIRALLDGRKTQTRRVLKPSVNEHGRREWPCYLDSVRHGSMCHPPRIGEGPNGALLSPTPVAPGDRLWVREAWCDVNDHGIESIAYRADSEIINIDEGLHDTLGDKYLYSTWANDLVGGVEGSWRPSIHMPRWASRLTLTVTDVRVQRVQEITEADAQAEGIERLKSGRGFYDPTKSKGAVHLGARFDWAADAFGVLWNSLNASRGFGWDDNPWVTATTFTVHRCNVDALEGAI